jgi:hypothetical protein
MELSDSFGLYFFKVSVCKLKSHELLDISTDLREVVNERGGFVNERTWSRGVWHSPFLPSRSRQRRQLEHFIDIHDAW